MGTHRALILFMDQYMTWPACVRRRLRTAHRPRGSVLSAVAVGSALDGPLRRVPRGLRVGTSAKLSLTPSEYSGGTASSASIRESERWGDGRPRGRGQPHLGQRLSTRRNVRVVDELLEHVEHLPDAASARSSAKRRASARRGGYEAPHMPELDLLVRAERHRRFQSARFRRRGRAGRRILPSVDSAHQPQSHHRRRRLRRGTGLRRHPHAPTPSSRSSPPHRHRRGTASRRSSTGTAGSPVPGSTGRHLAVRDAQPRKHVSRHPGRG